MFKMWVDDKPHIIAIALAFDLDKTEVIALLQLMYLAQITPDDATILRGTDARYFPCAVNRMVRGPFSLSASSAVRALKTLEIRKIIHRIKMNGNQHYCRVDTNFIEEYVVDMYGSKVFGPSAREIERKYPVKACGSRGCNCGDE